MCIEKSICDKRSAMSFAQFVAMVTTLIGGGAMGALLNRWFSHRANRRQPVEFTREIIHIFRKGQNFPRLAKLMVVEHPLGFGEDTSVDNLSLARFKLTNKGNQDIGEFAFGITMESGQKIVDIRMIEPDRHHTMKVSLSEKGPVTNPDFILKPFNRDDSYSVDVYLTYDGEPGEILLSSPHAVLLVEADPDKELMRIRRLEYFMWKIALPIIVLLLGYAIARFYFFWEIPFWNNR